VVRVRKIDEGFIEISIRLDRRQTRRSYEVDTRWDKDTEPTPETLTRIVLRRGDISGGRAPWRGGKDVRVNTVQVRVNAPISRRRPAIGIHDPRARRQEDVSPPMRAGVFDCSRDAEGVVEAVIALTRIRSIAKVTKLADVKQTGAPWIRHDREPAIEWDPAHAITRNRHSVVSHGENLGQRHFRNIALDLGRRVSIVGGAQRERSARTTQAHLCLFAWRRLQVASDDLDLAVQARAHLCTEDGARAQPHRPGVVDQDAVAEGVPAAGVRVGDPHGVGLASRDHPWEGNRHRVGIDCDGDNGTPHRGLGRRWHWRLGERLGRIGDGLVDHHRLGSEMNTGDEQYVPRIPAYRARVLRIVIEDGVGRGGARRGAHRAKKQHREDQCSHSRDCGASREQHASWPGG
jgi:hypothetical protein